MASAAEQLAANMNFGAFQKATELHKRILFTLGALIVYRLGTYIPIPGIDPAAFAQAFQGQAQGILGMFNMFSGGAVQRMAIFSLNVMPYISASIIVQLLGTVYPPWEKLRKEGGEAGRKTLNQYTRYLTVVLALFQSFAIATGLQNSPGLVLNPGLFFLASTVVTLTGGTLFLMWLGEQITSRGVGNGISLIIFAGIVAQLPVGVASVLELGRQGTFSPIELIGLLFMVVAVIMFIVFMERAQRRVIVQYPKRQAGNGMTGSEQNHLPLKLNTSGVIPPIFASSLLLLPLTVVGFSGGQGGDVTDLIQRYLSHGSPLYMFMYAALIIFFAFFYTAIVFNPGDNAEMLRKYGGFIPGIRPGKSTADYLDYVLTRITFVGALYLVLICLLPEFLIAEYSMPFYFGGTSILIVVSVTMDTVAQIHSHMVAHQYEGLIRKAKLRGRLR